MFSVMTAFLVRVGGCDPGPVMGSGFTAGWGGALALVYYSARAICAARLG